jgi:hypothetical protein
MLGKKGGEKLSKIGDMPYITPEKILGRGIQITEQTEKTVSRKGRYEDNIRRALGK